MKIFEGIYEEPAIAFPQTIGRIAFPRDDENQTQPHQDWIFVGGSTETISCWAPLGDIPIDDQNTTFRLQEGDIFAIRYRLIRDFVDSGRVELV